MHNYAQQKLEQQALEIQFLKEDNKLYKKAVWWYMGLAILGFGAFVVTLIVDYSGFCS